ncbi:MAG: DnaA/Hda family protein, partial [Alphaproteobacteria bacterium]|nr:DnaA/Hda family protein [Alphaproteobacteria bacterium]
NENTLTLVAQNNFSADYIKNTYLNILNSVADDFDISLNLTTSAYSYKTANNISANDNESYNYVPAHETRSINSFDKFIVSDENMFAVMACKKIATDSTSSFSQLFVYGPAGCGKTTLLQCIQDAADEEVVMLSGGQFVSEFARSLRDKTIFSFKDFCRNCDIFILDDVCALAGKTATTEEFLQLLIDLKNAGKKIILTANTTPNNLIGFDRRIQSLFGSGLVVDIKSPNTYVRRILLERAKVAKDVAEELSKRIPADGHIVNGIISKIKAYTELMGENVNMDIACRLLGDTLTKVKTPLTMVKTMCDKMCVSFDEVCGSSRSRRLVRARQIMMLVLKKVTTLSLSEIGNLCGGRDHATVVYAINQIESQKATDLMLSAEIEDMIKLCK